MNTQKEQPNYSILAYIYDEVMHDVDYITWTDYIDEIIMEPHPRAQNLLELACGTGTMAISMEEFGYNRIVATDLAPKMIERATQKGKEAGSKVEFKTRDFLDLNLDETFDVAYMVFDSLNYLHESADILKLHAEVKKILNPGGLFIYDFTTPRNSRKAIKYLNNDEATVDDRYHYFRSSSYDGQNQIHTNRFEIQPLSGNRNSEGETFIEEHQQRIYTYYEVKEIIDQTDFKILKAYDGFDLKPAHKKSLRITMVLYNE